MAEELQHKGEFTFENWRTTNKVEEDGEVLTGYAKFTGIVPAEWFEILTSTAGRKTYEKFVWAGDKAPAYPSLGALPIDAELPNYVVEFHGGIRYKEKNATIRGFKLEAVYGNQWSASFEILVHPKTEAVTGRFANREHHTITVDIQGLNAEDLFSNSNQPAAQGEGESDGKGADVVDIQTGGKGRSGGKAPAKRKASKRDGKGGGASASKGDEKPAKKGPTLKQPPIPGGKDGDDDGKK